MDNFNENQKGVGLFAFFRGLFSNTGEKGPLDGIIAKFLLYGIPILILVGGLSYYLWQRTYYDDLVNKNIATTAQIEDLKKKYKDDIIALNNEFALKTMKEIFNEANLKFLMEKFWTYDFTVNGKKVTSDTINVRPGKITIILSEKRRASKMPVELINIGSATAGDKNDKLANALIRDDRTNLSVLGPVSKVAENEVILTYTATGTAGKKIVFQLHPSLADEFTGGKIELTINVK